MVLGIQQNLTQDLRLTQELVMTPQLQQAIKLLQMTRMELVERVQEEMVENPLLEEESTDGGEEEAQPPQPEEPADQGKESAAEQQIDWDQYLNHYDSPPPSDRPLEIPEDNQSYENIVSPDATLQDHLLWQLRVCPLDENEMLVGEAIIGNIDENGYLKATTEELFQLSGAPAEVIKDVLDVVQQFEPTGVGARDLKECLLCQAVEAQDSPVVLAVIEHGLDLLETKSYKKLARRLDITFDQVVEAAQRVSTFEPRPGRGFSSLRVDYVLPDVFVERRGDEFIVTLNDEGLPRLRVSPYYRSLLSNDTEDGKEAKGYIQERMQAAIWLIKSINQRQQTLLKTAKSIVHFQRDFFLNGENHLRPLILKDVAEEIEMHESTVSRVTTAKYMHTPQGIFELKYFFSSAIRRADGSDLASRSVKARIKEVVSKEDPQKPMSDIQIAKVLAEEFSLKIARRTVSKYREQLGILPSSSRKSFF